MYRNDRIGEVRGSLEFPQLGPRDMTFVQSSTEKIVKVCVLGRNGQQLLKSTITSTSYDQLKRELRDKLANHYGSRGLVPCSRYGKSRSKLSHYRNYLHCAQFPENTLYFKAPSVTPDDKINRSTVNKREESGGSNMRRDYIDVETTRQKIEQPQEQEDIIRLYANGPADVLELQHLAEQGIGEVTEHERDGTTFVCLEIRPPE